MIDIATRKERLSIISQILTNHPNHLYPLSYFSEMFGSAKSTLSEDISIIKETLHKYGQGEIEVLMGAGGGVRYLPYIGEAEKEQVMKEILKNTQLKLLNLQSKILLVDQKQHQILQAGFQIKI